MSRVVPIKYSKKQLRFSWLFGVLWLCIFGFYTIFLSDSYFGYGYLIIGILFLGTYIYKKTVHYITIKNGVLTKHGFFSKHVPLDQIKEVRYFAGKYKLVTPTSEVIINTMLIEKQSLDELKKILDHLNRKS